MSLRKNNAVVNSEADHYGDLWDGGTLDIYTGTQPADPNSGPSGTLLVSIAIPTPAFGAAVSGTIAKAGTWQDTAVATGTAGWARMTSADTLKTMDFTVSASGGGGDAIISTAAVVSGNTITVNSLSITNPAL